METLDLSSFIDENYSSEVLAYEHALDLAYLFVREMEARGLTRKQLAEKMGIPQSRLSKLLNTQPNMTLETIAQFELALDMRIDFSCLSLSADALRATYRIIPKIESYSEWRALRRVDGVEASTATVSSTVDGSEPSRIDNRFGLGRLAA